MSFIYNIIGVVVLLVLNFAIFAFMQDWLINFPAWMADNITLIVFMLVVVGELLFMLTLNGVFSA